MSVVETRSIRGRWASTGVAWLAVVLAGILSLGAATANADSCQSGTKTFAPTGAEQCYIVPANVFGIKVNAVGAPGGTGAQPNNATYASPAAGGRGATATGILTVYPGETLYVEVGGDGGAGTYNANGNNVPGGSAGWDGGAAGGTASLPGIDNGHGSGGGGGGASAVQSQSCGSSCPSSGTLSKRLIVAGGGGGGGGDTGSAGGDGSQAGQAGAVEPGCTGDCPIGGAGGANASGAGSTGGAGSEASGGGGAGGYAGGNGGEGAAVEGTPTVGLGGGGGSSYGPHGTVFGTASAGTHASVTITPIVHEAVVTETNNFAVAPVGGPVGNTAVGDAIATASGPEADAVTPDGKTAVVANLSDGSVSIIDLTSDTVDETVALDYISLYNYDNAPEPTAVAISPSGQTAYVTDEANNVVIPITISDGTISGAIPVGFEPDAIAITPDGCTAYVANAGDYTVTPLNVGCGKNGDPISVGSDPSAIAITPDGSTAYVANQSDNTVSAIDIATNSVVKTFAVGNAPDALAVTPDARTLYVADNSDQAVVPVDLPDGTVGTGIGVTGYPTGLGVTPDGTTLEVSSYNSSTVTPIDLTTNPASAGPAVSTGGENGAYGLAIAWQDGLEIGTPSLPDGTVNQAYSQTLWSVAGTAPVSYTVSQGSLPGGLTLSGDGVLSGTPTTTGSFTFSVQATDSSSSPVKTAKSYTVTIKEQPAPAQVLVTSQNSNSLTSIDPTSQQTSTISVGGSQSALAVSPTGRAVYVGTGTSVDGIDLATDQQLGTVSEAGHGGIAALGVTPDGTQFIEGSTDGTLDAQYTANYQQNGSAFPGEANAEIDGLAVTPDGSKVLVTDDSESPSHLSVYPLGNDPQTGVDIGTSATAVVVAPDGQTAYVADPADNTIVPFNISARSTGSSFSAGQDPVALALSPDARTLWVVNGSANTVTPFNLVTQQAGSPIAVGNNPDAVAVSPDGSTVYVANKADGTVTPINASTDQAGSAITVGSNPNAVAVSSGQKVYVGNDWLRGATMTSSYSQPLWTSSGQAPFTWSVTSGSLPPGITLSSSGLLSGTPTATGSYTFTVRATDATGVSGTATLTLPIDQTPTVSGLSPTAGPSAGGTSVTITGTNFSPDATVKFGSVAATSVTVNSSTTITATSPKQGVGTVDVTVSNSAGTSATSSADQFICQPDPATVLVTSANSNAMTAIAARHADDGHDQRRRVTVRRRGLARRADGGCRDR